MNGVVRFLTILATLLMGVTSIATVSAEQSSTATVTQRVLSGELTYSLNGGQTETVVLDVASPDQITVTETIGLLVEDLRGTREGWTIYIEVEGGVFRYNGGDDPGYDIPAADTTVTPQTPQVQAGQGREGITVYDQQQFDGRIPVLAAVEGAGSGRYYQEILIQTNAPAGHPAGTYTADVTVTSSAAPGQ